MAGVLLAPGPISTLVSVKRLSRVFNDGLSQHKFLSAANKLVDSGFGILVNTGQQVFVKRSPAEVGPLLASSDIGDLCSSENYQNNYIRPTSTVVSRKLKQALVAMGAVKAELFHDL